MLFWDNLKAKWKAMPTGEKLKMIVNGVCDVGACFLTDALTKKFYDQNDCGKLKKLTINTAVTGLGMWAGSAAGKQFGDVIDTIYGTEQEGTDE